MVYILTKWLLYRLCDTLTAFSRQSSMINQSFFIMIDDDLHLLSSEEPIVLKNHWAVLSAKRSHWLSGIWILIFMHVINIVFNSPITEKIRKDRKRLIVKTLMYFYYILSTSISSTYIIIIKIY